MASKIFSVLKARLQLICCDKRIEGTTVPLKRPLADSFETSET
jgi:hypothetical protein